MNKINLLGSEFETSLRLLLLLEELHDFALDESQIVCIDFISIYGADFGILDENIHGSGLFRFSEFSAKSKTVSHALKRLVLKRYVNFTTNKTGYSYSISEDGKNILSAIHDDYATEYSLAVHEVSNAFPTLSVSDMQKKIYNTTISSLEA